MKDIFSELIQLKQNILGYLELKREDFEVTKSEIVDSSRFSTIDDYSRMTTVFTEMNQNANMYRNASNFLVRLNSISNGIDLNSDDQKMAVCVSAFLILKATDEYRIVINELETRFSQNVNKSNNL